MLLFLIILLHLLVSPSALMAQPADLEEQVRIIASQLRCPVCQNLSVADSPSELARQMRDLIREQISEGKSPEQIKAYFVSKYGEWVLLAPKPKGFRLLVWVLPFAVASGGILLVVFVTRRWVRQKNKPQPQTLNPDDLRNIRQEVEEIEFDFQAGRFSENDYREMRRELEARAAMVEEHLRSVVPTQPDPQPLTYKTKPRPKRDASKKERLFYRRWPIVAGGTFLLLFGFTGGVLLIQSLRPRVCEQDSITGDFLTGTGPDISSLLAQGRAGFERQEWSKAIEAFKKALAIDPNLPEAHTYMGFILLRAGHTEGALLAFDRALSSTPDFPPALWGKGMVLYRTKGDLPGAREALGKLVSLVPAGRDRDEIQKILDELRKEQRQEKRAPKTETASGTSSRIEGTISVDPKVRAKVKDKTVLFVIAHSVNSASGPPLAVRKVDHPIFPVTYSLGPTDIKIGRAHV